MIDETRAWLEGLVWFVAANRERKPVAEADDPDASAAERGIVAASLATRFAELESVREAWRLRTGTPADPVIVVTTSAAGMDAVTGLAADPFLAAIMGDRLVAVSELEYRLWCIRNPDDDHQRHLNLWSWVKTRVPRQRWAEFAAFPLAEGETYWLHREGLAGAGPLDRRACHLWKWNGRHAALLRAFVAERGV